MCTSSLVVLKKCLWILYKALTQDSRLLSNVFVSTGVQENYSGCYFLHSVLHIYYNCIIRRAHHVTICADEQNCSGDIAPVEK